MRLEKERKGNKGLERNVYMFVGFFFFALYSFSFSFLLMRLWVLLFLFILLRMDEVVGAKGMERVEARGDKLVFTLIIGKLPTKPQRKVQKH